MKKIYLLILNVLIILNLFSQAVKLDSSRLPICIIDTRGKTIANEPKILAHMKVIDNGPGKMNYVKDKSFNYNNFIAIEIRGNSSQFYPQKQYGLELRDSVSGADIKAPIMGMPSEEDWVLYAPYNDISLLRNVITYKLWNQMGHWGPRTRFCEVVINNDYVGVYIMMESIKRGQDRVDIAKLKSEDTSGINLTGGYIMKVDKQNASTDLSFISKVKSTDNKDITWLYHYPDSKDIVPQQKNYIQKFIDTVEQVVASAKFADPVNGYRKYISVNSFIDYFLIQEFTRNIDAYKASSYFYKEKLDSTGGKGQFKAGPVWDYNFAYGNASFCSGAQTNGWMYDGCVPATLPTPAIWKKLLTDTNYLNDVKCRYIELRKTILDTGYLFQFLNKYAFDTLNDAQKRHYTRWKILGTNPGGFNAYIASSYNDEMSRLKTWIKNRLSWMDANLGGRCINPPTIVKIEAPLDPPCTNGLRQAISLNHPFNTAPFNYTGQEKVKSIPKDIIRWVLVELRDAKDSTVLIDRRAAFLKSDSTIIDTNFLPGVFFSKAVYNTAYALLVRYDSYSYLFSKDKIVIPNNNDYNLNHIQRLSKISNSSPLIYLNPIFGSDTFHICAGQKLVLSDSNLIKAGYVLDKHTITSIGVATIKVEANGINIQFSTEGINQLELDFECNGLNIIKSKIIVNVHPIPIPVIIGAVQKCIRDTIQIYSENYVRYSWSTGSTTNQISIAQAGTYKLTVTDRFGCVGNAEKLITNYPDIEGQLISKQGNISGKCNYYFIPNDPNVKYKFSWETGENSDSISTSLKLIKLVVTDEHNCTKQFNQTCIPLSAGDLESSINIRIIPNPSHGNFNLITEEDNLQIDVFTIAGQLLYSGYFQNKQNKYFENWQSGIYIIKIRKGEDMKILRFVVE